MLTLHWLNESRASSILWLLVALDIPYSTKLYYRDKAFRAPEELKKIHPLGKSPVIEDEGKVIVETPIIAKYLVDKYGEGSGLEVVKGSADEEKLNYWLIYSEADFMQVMMPLVISSKARQLAPFFVRPLVAGVTSKMDQSYALGELKAHFEYLESTLRENKSGYIVSNHLTAADILLYRCYRWGCEFATPGPLLKQWAEKLANTDAFKKFQEEETRLSQRPRSSAWRI